MAAAEMGVCGHSERPKVSAKRRRPAPSKPASGSMARWRGPTSTRARCGASKPMKATCPTRQMAAAAARAVRRTPCRRVCATSVPRQKAMSSPKASRSRPDAWVSNKSAASMQPRIGSQASSSVAVPNQSPAAPLTKISRASGKRAAISNVPAAVKAFSPSPVSKSFVVDRPRPSQTKTAEVAKAPPKAAAGRAQR